MCFRGLSRRLPALGAHEQRFVTGERWNTRGPRVRVPSCGPESTWRNRDTFVSDRGEIVAFLTQK
ncbi:DUF1348 family protein [Streptomyces echinoruber]|uniref:DUF1348 family protein n=1 Tax=Streptomyces echinoruber TaxID=68898 RepID=UPI00167D640F|nr:DUF1348 family protein [Streptomyces echinoruber]